MTSQYRLNLSLLAAIALMAGGCAKDMGDLEQYISAQVNQAPAPLEPLPPIRTFETIVYDPAGRRDPFESPFATEEPEPTEVADANARGPDPLRRKEPLESFPLDALDMVGTLNMEDNLWGLIKDPDGLIHRVKVDNYLGQQHGRIIQIDEDRVSLIEWVPNNIGGWIEKEASIALDDNLAAR